MTSQVKIAFSQQGFTRIIEERGSAVCVFLSQQETSALLAGVVITCSLEGLIRFALIRSQKLDIKGKAQLWRLSAASYYKAWCLGIFRPQHDI